MGGCKVAMEFKIVMGAVLPGAQNDSDCQHFEQHIHCYLCCGMVGLKAAGELHLAVPSLLYRFPGHIPTTAPAPFPAMLSSLLLAARERVSGATYECGRKGERV